MYNYILNSVRSITLEIAKLEGLSKQMAKTHDKKRKMQYEDMLTWCKNEKERIFEMHHPEEILENFRYKKDDVEDEDELIMAIEYYIKGLSWEDAFRETNEYLEMDLENLNEDEVDKLIKVRAKTHQRNIERKVAVFYSFNKKSGLS